jgi:hypothetical protein
LNRKIQIGFTQRMQLKWLDRTAGLLSAGSSSAEIKHMLSDLLKDQLSINGTAERSSRAKTITILLKTWVTVPSQLRPFRDEGLEHFRRLPVKDHLPVHWGMAMAVYPFFSVVAETVGRLLKLQGTASASQVQRRVREMLGERETVSRATRRVLRTMIDWEAIHDARPKGTYRSCSTHRIKDPRLAGWLIEACLLGSGASSAMMDVISQSPSLFPFTLPWITARDLSGANRLEVFRQGGDTDTIALRRNGTHE